MNLTESHPWYDDDFNPMQIGVLREGMDGDDIVTLQQLLNRHGADLVVDGDFGNGTEKAVMAYQRQKGLVEDGVVGAKTLTFLLGWAVNKPLLTQADLQWAAVELAADLAAVMAVSHVESRGSGFFVNGKAVILYERHVMRRQLQARGIHTEVHMAQCPNLVNTKTGGYRGGVAEYERLEQAISIDRCAALESCSWGAYQIMGYHWKRLGYASVSEYVDLMQIGERQHLEAFVRFIQLDSNLLTALREQDWTRFARLYNGPGYRKNQYDTKLAAAYGKFQVAQTA